MKNEFRKKSKKTLTACMCAIVICCACLITAFVAPQKTVTAESSAIGSAAPMLRIEIPEAINWGSDTSVWYYSEIFEPYEEKKGDNTGMPDFENKDCHYYFISHTEDSKKYISAIFYNYEFPKCTAEEKMEIEIEVNGVTYVLDKNISNSDDEKTYSKENFADETAVIYMSTTHNEHAVDVYLNILLDDFGIENLTSLAITRVTINDNLIVGKPVTPIIPDEPDDSPEQAPKSWWTNMVNGWKSFCNWFVKAGIAIENFFTETIPNFFTVQIPNFFTKLGDNIKFLFKMEYSKFYW